MIKDAPERAYLSKMYIATATPLVLASISLAAVIVQRRRPKVGTHTRGSVNKETRKRDFGLFVTIRVTSQTTLLLSPAVFKIYAMAFMTTCFDGGVDGDGGDDGDMICFMTASPEVDEKEHAEAVLQIRAIAGKRGVTGNHFKRGYQKRHPQPLSI